MRRFFRSVFQTFGQRITSLPDRIVAKVRFRKYAALSGAALAGVALVGGLAAMYSSGEYAGPMPAAIGRSDETPVSTVVAHRRFVPKGIRRLPTPPGRRFVPVSSRPSVTRPLPSSRSSPGSTSSLPSARRGAYLR